MRIFGLEISRARKEKALSGVPGNRGGWWPVVWESFSGAWQRNVEVRYDSVLSFHADFACKTLIASDIAKMRVKLVARGPNDIWTETTNPAYAVLRKPNPWQTRIQFFESWVISKLQRGNAYILKVRDGRNVVKQLYVLDPQLVTPLVSDTGEVFYQLNADSLAGVQQAITVPAREIIHDRFNCIFHPLVGVSPIFAGGLAAMQGLAIQNNSTEFFQGGSTAPGILTAPGAISDETATRLKTHWETNYTGKGNAKKVAVLGDGLKYEAMSMKNTDAQLIEQLRWTAEVVCSVYHVPPYKIGVGQMPTVNNVQSLNIEYYSQALQVLIESIELCLDEGLNTGENLGTEFDLDGLLRMDSAMQMDVLEKSKGKMTVNEQRRRLNLPPVDGGDTVYLQEQDHSLEWLSRRDAQPIEAPAPEPAATEPEPDSEQARAYRALFEKDLHEALNA
ncbi:MAG: phage portal protein [Xanthobacteraceae bacterium]